MPAKAFEAWSSTDVMTVFSRSLAAGLLLALPATACLADPTGRYNVVGVNPDNGAEYRGSVRVTRTGETYKVVWTIGGVRYVGTGLGALVRDGRYTVGPAHPEDTSISIGYISGRTFGQAFYFEQDDGTWRGVWTYAGSNKITSETWFRK